MASAAGRLGSFDPLTHAIVYGHGSPTDLRVHALLVPRFDRRTKEGRLLKKDAKENKNTKCEIVTKRKRCLLGCIVCGENDDQANLLGERIDKKVNTCGAPPWSRGDPTGGDPMNNDKDPLSTPKYFVPHLTPVPCTCAHAHSLRTLQRRRDAHVLPKPAPPYRPPREVGVPFLLRPDCLWRPTSIEPA